MPTSRKPIRSLLKLFLRESKREQWLVPLHPKLAENLSFIRSTENVSLHRPTDDPGTQRQCGNALIETRRSNCHCSWRGICQFLSAELGWGHLLLIPSSFRSQTELFPMCQSAQEGQAGQVLASTTSFPSLGTHCGGWGGSGYLFLNH